MLQNRISQDKNLLLIDFVGKHTNLMNFPLPNIVNTTVANIASWWLVQLAGGTASWWLIQLAVVANTASCGG